MGNCYFEEMREEHLDQVLQIYTHYVLNTTATFHALVPSLAEMKELVFFDNDKYKTFVILSGKAICGYVFITQHKKREAYDATAEVSIYLRPDSIGEGFGSMALLHIENYAKQQGLHVLIATICKENRDSIRLFEKNGYSQCAHYKEVGRKFGKLLDILAYQKIIS